MIRHVVICFAVAVLGVSEARAGLGETMEQAVAHYGPVLTKEQNSHLPPVEAAVQYTFSKSGFQIIASFVNGKIAWIHYAKEPGHDQPIFDTEIRTLLDANAQSSKWDAGRDIRGRFDKKKIGYERADGLANAEYEELDRRLTGTSGYSGLVIITRVWREATSGASGL